MRDPHRIRPARARSAALVVLAALAFAAPAPPAGAEEGAEVRVERVKPDREKLPTLRFLKENKDWIRARFDLLREKAIGGAGDATEIDPRFLAYQRLLADVAAGGDSAATLAEKNERLALLASITELGTLEAQLDALERLLGAQTARLAELESDFTGRQRTELLVLLRGVPGSAERLVITVADGGTHTVPLGEAERQSLAAGGVMRVYQAFVEPREQIIEVRIEGAGWAAESAGYMALEPARDRLTLLEIDLTGTVPADGGAGVRARTWLHEAVSLSIDG
jgi:hypothetical protein